jgi:hypothetical protein
MGDQLLPQLIYVSSEVGSINESLTSFDRFGQFIPERMFLHYVGHRFTSLDFECFTLFSLEFDDCLFKFNFEVIGPHFLFLQVLELIAALNSEACLSLLLSYLRCTY